VIVARSIVAESIVGSLEVTGETSVDKMRLVRSFSCEGFEIGGMCDVIKGKYQGYRGTVERLTSWKIVIRLDGDEGRSVMILQSSVRLCELGVELVMGPLSQKHAVRIVSGRYAGLDGVVVRVHRWMVTIKVPTLKLDVRVFQTSVRCVVRTNVGPWPVPPPAAVEAPSIPRWCREEKVALPPDVIADLKVLQALLVDAPGHPPIAVSS
jgi:transcription antitermination factor NusG